jgi:hypothetical protein
MNNLTIQGFVNEMSYDLSMQELENLVIDYQHVILDYVVNNQYNYKARKEFNEVCSLIRSDKFFKSISFLIQAEDERIISDMAYVLYTATHLSHDDELKGDAFVLGYTLREKELGNNITGHQETDIAVLIASVKAVRSYDVTPFFRSKEVENILENLPEVLYNAYHEKYNVNQISENVISTILTRAVIDLKPEEIITAFCKTCLPKDMKKEYKPYASRIQAFLYKVCGSISEDKFKNALSAACNSINKYNERANANETLMDKYLNYKLLEAVINSKDAKVPYAMKLAYKRMSDFKAENKKYSNLF